MGKYRKLQDHLAASAGPVRMTFEEIERLVGPLPGSARRYAAWWANTRTNRSQSRAWLNVGYVARRVDLRAGAVDFVPETALSSDPPLATPSTAGPRTAGAGSPSPAPTAFEVKVDWDDVLSCLVERMSDHVGVGLEHLLTEDVVRWELVGSLLQCGVLSAAIRIEHQEPTIATKFDLVIGEPVTSVAELKYPRDPAAGFGAADTMTTGELLRDFYRLAWTGIQDSWAVHVLQPRLLGHLRRRPEIDWVTEPGQSMRLEPGLSDRLPRTAAACLPPWTSSMDVVAECRFNAAVGPLTLVGYRVAAV